MKNTKKGSFIVISDFHSYKWPLNKIKDYYLDEYETIYILGDATDRGEKSDGTGGIHLLLEIKRLADAYPGRVIYVPGNHDEFLYEYARYDNKDAKACLEWNQGTVTIEHIDNLRKSNPKRFEELMNWLGSLPIQREHYFEGKRYVLAHALFNEKLFQKNKYFSLEDYRKARRFSKKYQNILWFRKENDDYDKKTLPRGDSIMVIGHTPQCYRDGLNLDLVNEYGETVKVHCVDGGIAYEGIMQKYTGGVHPMDTLKGVHATKPRDEDTIVKDEASIEECVNKLIINYIKKNNSLEQAISDMLENSHSKCMDYFIINEKTNEKISCKRVRKYLDELYMSYLPAGKEIVSVDYMDIFKRHFAKVAFDYIIKCQFIRFRTLDHVLAQQREFEKFDEYDYITSSVGDARSIATKVGIDNLYKWLDESEYRSFSEYIKAEYGNVYIKRK